MKWFKKKERSLPEDTVCRNCGAQTVGRYCHECGQDLLAGVGQPILKLIAQVLDNAFALEGKTPRTLINLIIRPGFLSKEYSTGRITRYVHPVKLFWMSTIIFFALVISQINLSDIKIDEPTPEAIDFATTLIHYFTKFAPYATFFLIPIFALLLACFFWRKKIFYLFHLIFAAHFHTFLWIFLSILLIINIFTPNFEYPEWLSFLLFLIPWVYLSIGFHRFYQTKTRWKAIKKSIGISMLYFSLVIAVTALLVILAAKLFFPEIWS